MANNVAQNLDRLYTGLIYVHRGMLQFYKKLDVGNVQQRRQVRLHMYRNIQELGRLIHSLKPLISQQEVQQQEIKQTGTQTEFFKIAASGFTTLLSEVIKFADYLDNIGAYALADTVTESTVLVKQAFIPKMKEEGEREVPPIQPPHEGTLSTRYCPDHRGVQAIRVAERTYQCPIDGKIYNYETGYVNYQGQQVLGGSVADQTPISSNYGGIPMRVYDSNQSILNRIN